MEILTDQINVSTITIIDDDAPELRIGDGEVVTESDQAMAMFPITASFNANEITVYFTPIQNGDFLGGGLTHNVSASATIDFAGGTNAMLPIPIANDEDVEADGFIIVMLNEDKNMENGQPVITYSIGEDSTSGMVEVVDDDKLPVISIIPDSGDAAENAGPAKFMLTATGFTPDSNLTLEYKRNPSGKWQRFLNRFSCGCYC